MGEGHYLVECAPKKKTGVKQYPATHTKRELHEKTKK
jgi:hypothetical protein